MPVFKFLSYLGGKTAEPVLNAARIASVTAELSARALNKSSERMIVAVRRKEKGKPGAYGQLVQSAHGIPAVQTDTEVVTHSSYGSNYDRQRVLWPSDDPAFPRLFRQLL